MRMQNTERRKWNDSLENGIEEREASCVGTLSIVNLCDTDTSLTHHNVNVMVCYL